MTKRALLAVAVFALIAMGQDSCSTSDDKPAKEGSGSNAASGGSGGGSSEPTPDPDGTFSLNCDYLLGGSGGDDYSFVAGGTIKNTGNVGIKTETVFHWELLGQEPLTESQSDKLEPGQRKRVNVTLPATGDQIDLHQSANSKCKAKTKIVGSYGKPE